MNPQALFEAIGLAPSLPGAACRGRHDLFDPPEAHTKPENAHAAEQAALRICSWCPALARCENWYETLPRGWKPLGVIAGTVNRPKAVGRPRRSA